MLQVSLKFADARAGQDLNFRTWAGLKFLCAVPKDCDPGFQKIVILLVILVSPKPSVIVRKAFGDGALMSKCLQITNWPVMYGATGIFNL